MALKERMEDFYFEVELPDGAVEVFSAGKKEGGVGREYARLKLAFLKKNGREMTPGEMKQAIKLIKTTREPKNRV
jgi:hypothetical protein